MSRRRGRTTSHRTWRRARDTLGDAAHHHARDAGASAGAHDDEITSAFERVFVNHGRRPPGPNFSGDYDMRFGQVGDRATQMVAGVAYEVHLQTGNLGGVDFRSPHAGRERRLDDVQHVNRCVECLRKVQRVVEGGFGIGSEVGGDEDTFDVHNNSVRLLCAS